MFIPYNGSVATHIGRFLMYYILRIGFAGGGWRNCLIIVGGRQIWCHKLLLNFRRGVHCSGMFT